MTKNCGSVMKNLPAMQELQGTWIRSLGRENPLEEGAATHSSILAWRNPGTEEPTDSPWGRRESETNEPLASVILCL